MMKKELKISELASIWGVSVPTAWNRIRKEGLITFKKKDENNKEVNFVEVPEEFLKENIKNGYKDVKNGYYEELLTDDNVNNDVIDVEYTRQDKEERQNQLIEFVNGLIAFNKDYNELLQQVHKDYNERLKEVNNELVEAKSKTLLLEDSEKRTKQNIDELKATNKTLEEKNKTLEETFKEVNKELAESKNNASLLEDSEKRIKEDMAELKAVFKRYKVGLITLSTTFILVVATLSVLLILAIKKPPEIRTVEVEKIIEKPVVKYVKR